MTLTMNQERILLSVSANPDPMVTKLPVRDGVAAEEMEADITRLEELLFVTVRRADGLTTGISVAPFGWGYLRSRANMADNVTHPGPELRGSAVVTIGVRPTLHLVEKP